MMRSGTLLAAAAIVAAGLAQAFAAEPAKTMETSLGVVLADSKGMTLYVFDKDTPGVSNCYDKCAANWPPLAAPADAMAMGEWTVVERKDGTRMWAHKGMPLYTFVKDKAPGDVTGEGAAGVWHVAR